MTETAPAEPAQRYTAALAGEIEQKILVALGIAEAPPEEASQAPSVDPDEDAGF